MSTFKRYIFINLLLWSGVFPFLVPLSVFGQQSKTTTQTNQTQNVPVPYQREEFPTWLLDLRRADIVAFGSLPFMMFFTTFAVDSYRYYMNDWDRRYAPWPLKASGAIEMDENQRIASFSVAVGLSVVVAVVDYLIVKHKWEKQKKLAPPIVTPRITIEPWSPNGNENEAPSQNRDSEPSQ
ncbi:hypothetical protein [Gracilinema caldarium]|uniref:Uncharacterized protein n=1 Tax=Gracilinema caldarium (strain ATCC 51460 / DSM 7334 / H1) TaxID=744872 RepID=F8F0M0_GRAC1|nr:hypothetical protein [Gracilinema caldarium]AEJ19727.1 hypothetical protein Spica_1584 [Gracilinema caldarium DSM 7334]